MDRKHFLSTLLVLPAGIFLVHCSSDSSTDSNASAGTGGSGGTGGSPDGTGGGDAGDPDAPAAPPTQNAGQDSYTSSQVGKHHHTFTIDDTAFSAPPADGVSGDSSTDGAHSHTVAVSTDELAQVGAGQSVTVTSGLASGHTHVFTFVKIA